MTSLSLGNLQGKIGRIGAPGCKGDPGEKVSLAVILNSFFFNILLSRCCFQMLNVIYFDQGEKPYIWLNYE